MASTLLNSAMYVSALLVAVGCSTASSVPAPQTAATTASKSASGDPAATPEFYTHNVQPILQQNCYRCHGGMNHRGGLSLQTRAGMLKGGHDGTVIVPGDPADSLIVRLIRHEGPANDPMPMPPKSKISDADIATITLWVKAGAIMPPDAAQ